jgi:hypothetical protein
MRSRKRRLRWVIYGAVLLVVAFVAAAFPFGPLFPWSPWKPGYRLSHSLRADVYYPRGTYLKDAYENVDAAVLGAEKFLGMDAPQRITVVLCRDWADFEHMMPHLRSRGLGGVTLATGTVIYITPKLDEKQFDHGEFLRHEVLHAVMHQNQTVRNALAMKNVAWLFEGLAVSYGQQKAYLSRGEFLERARKEDLRASIDPALREEGKFDIRFAYPAWRYFTEFLRKQKTEERFLNYVHATMYDPDDWRVLFQQVLGQRFEDAITSFQQEVRAAVD